MSIVQVNQQVANEIYMGANDACINIFITVFYFAEIVCTMPCHGNAMC